MEVTVVDLQLVPHVLNCVFLWHGVVSIAVTIKYDPRPIKY